MNINEIEYGHWNKPSLPESSIIDSEPIGSFDNIDIYSLVVNKLQYFLILNDDKTYQGYISVKKGFVFNEAYVNEKNRRRGICSILILFVLRRLNKKLTLLPDEIITDDSRQLFYQLALNNKIRVTIKNKVVDLPTLGKIFAEVDDNMLKLVIESRAKELNSCTEIVNSHTGFAIVEGLSIGDSVRNTHWYN